MNLFRQRRKEHRADIEQRADTAQVLHAHQQSLKRVRQTLRKADETLGDEIRRLDLVLQRSGQ